MKLYTLTYEVLQATGSQTYCVRAESEEEAIQKYKNGEANCVYEDIEVGEVSEEPIHIEVEDTEEA